MRGRAVLRPLLVLLALAPVTWSPTFPAVPGLAFASSEVSNAGHKGHQAGSKGGKGAGDAPAYEQVDLPPPMPPEGRPPPPVHSPPAAPPPLASPPYPPPERSPSSSSASNQGSDAVLVGGLDKQSVRRIEVFVRIMAVLSLLGTSFIILSYYLCAPMQQFAFSLIFYLAVSELMSSVGYLIGNPEDGSAACLVQSYILTYFTNSGILWTSVIAHVLYHGIVNVGDSLEVMKGRHWYHAYTWGLSTITTILPQLTNSYGLAGTWCWIKGDTTGEFWRFLTFYVPLWAILCYNAYVYWISHARLTSLVRRAASASDLAGTSEQQPQKISNKLLVFPLLLWCTWLFPTINRVQNWISPNAPSYWLYFLTAIAVSSQGLLHSIAYSQTEMVRAAVSARGRRYLPVALSKRISGMSRDTEGDEPTTGEGVPHLLELSQRDAMVLASAGPSLSTDMAAIPLTPSLGRLRNVSHEIHAIYLKSLGMYEMVGLSVDVPTFETLRAISEEEIALRKHQQENGGAGNAKAGVASTYVTLFKSFVGIGILAFPSAVHEAGYVGATVGIIAIAIISLHCMQLLLKCQAYTKEHSTADECSNFSGLGSCVFGWRGRSIVDFALVSSQIGFSTAYLIFIGSNVHSALHLRSFTEDAVILLASTLLLPLVWLKEVKKLAFTSLLADGAILFGLITVIGYSLSTLSSKGWSEDGIASFRPRRMPLFFGLAVYSFEGIGLVIPIQQSMEEPQKLPNMLRNTVVGLTMLLVTIGCLSYMAYGDQTSDMITLNLPRNGLVSSVQLLYCLGLFFTYPLMMLPAFNILEDTKFFRSRFPVPASLGSHTKTNIFRMMMVAFTTTVAIVTPHFGLFVNLIGAVSCTLLAFVIPSAMAQKLFSNGQGRLVSCKNYGILIFGLVGGLISCGVTISELLAAFRADT